MRRERRSEVREEVALTVTIAGGAIGLTRDVSPSGLYFECQDNLGPMTEIGFTLDLEGCPRPMRLVGEGRVVRVERNGDGSGVGVRMLSSRLVCGPQ